MSYLIAKERELPRPAGAVFRGYRQKPPRARVVCGLRSRPGQHLWRNPAERRRRRYPAHGAAPDSWFSHLAVEVPGEEASNEWLEAVSDTDYIRATANKERNENDK